MEHEGRTVRTIARSCLQSTLNNRAFSGCDFPRRRYVVGGHVYEKIKRKRRTLITVQSVLTASNYYQYPPTADESITRFIIVRLKHTHPASISCLLSTRGAIAMKIFNFPIQTATMWSGSIGNIGEQMGKNCLYPLCERTDSKATTIK